MPDTANDQFLQYLHMKVQETLNGFANALMKRDPAELVNHFGMDAGLVVYGTGPNEKFTRGLVEILNLQFSDWSQTHPTSISFDSFSLSFVDGTPSFADDMVVLVAGDMTIHANSDGETRAFPARFTCVVKYNGGGFLPILQAHFSFPVANQAASSGGGSGNVHS